MHLLISQHSTLYSVGSRSFTKDARSERHPADTRPQVPVFDRDLLFRYRILPPLRIVTSSELRCCHQRFSRTPSTAQAVLTTATTDTVAHPTAFTARNVPALPLHAARRPPRSSHSVASPSPPACPAQPWMPRLSPSDTFPSFTPA